MKHIPQPVVKTFLHPNRPQNWGMARFLHTGFCTPESARKNRGGNVGAIFCAQLRRCVACSKYYVEPRTAFCAKPKFQEVSGSILLIRWGIAPKSVSGYWKRLDQFVRPRLKLRGWRRLSTKWSARDRHPVRKRLRTFVPTRVTRENPSGKREEERHYRPHIKQRREKADGKRKRPGYKARRCVVARPHSCLNRFRKLSVIFEKTEESYLALLALAAQAAEKGVSSTQKRPNALVVKHEINDLRTQGRSILAPPRVFPQPVRP